jgi:hypothetical protein
MKTRLLTALVIAAAGLAAAQADHMSPWGPGWANMPNDIHNTRLDTRGDNEAFIDFIRYGEGADSINRYLVEETVALEAELAAGHQVERLAARLDPLEGFLGGGWAKYTVFDGDTATAAVLNINVRLRLVRPSGATANEALVGLAEYAAEPATMVRADFRTYDGTDYASCRLVFAGLIVGEDELPEYAVFGLSLKVDANGLIEGTGSCVAAGAAATGEAVLPAVELGDIVDVPVQTPLMDAELAVLMGGF